MSLPDLPPSLLGQAWSDAVLQAVDSVRHIYEGANHLAESGTIEQHRIETHLNRLVQDAIPLLLELLESCDEEGIDVQWIETSAQLTSEVIAKLSDAQERAVSACVPSRNSSHL